MLLRDNEIPGYQEAVKRENDLRDAAFLDLKTDICGLKIRQMAPRDLLILDGLENPVTAFRVPTAEQLAFFLWLLSEDYSESKIKRFIFGRIVRKLPFEKAVLSSWKFVSDTFQDSPARSGGRSTPYAGWCAHLVDTIASQYGWPEEMVLQVPFKRLFQFTKVIRSRLDTEYSPHNPSDKIKREGALELFKARSKLLEVLKARRN